METERSWGSGSQKGSIQAVAWNPGNLLPSPNHKLTSGVEQRPWGTEDVKLMKEERLEAKEP